MTDPTDKQIAEAADRYLASVGVPEREGERAAATHDFEAGARWALAARQVPEDVAALVAELRALYNPERSDGLPDYLDAANFEEWAPFVVERTKRTRELIAALEASSRTVAPNREALLDRVHRALWEAHRGPLNEAEWPVVRDRHGETASVTLAQAEAVVGALADLWQPAPIIDRDTLIRTAIEAMVKSAEVPTGERPVLLGAVFTIRERVDAEVVARVVLDALLASGWQPASPTRFDPEFRADLIDFARQRIEMVWADVPGGVDAATLASNIVAAQEFCWMSRQVPVTQPASPRTVATVERAIEEALEVLTPINRSPSAIATAVQILRAASVPSEGVES